MTWGRNNRYQESTDVSRDRPYQQQTYSKTPSHQPLVVKSHPIKQFPRPTLGMMFTAELLDSSERIAEPMVQVDGWKGCKGYISGKGPLDKLEIGGNYRFIVTSDPVQVNRRKEPQKIFRAVVIRPLKWMEPREGPAILTNREVEYLQIMAQHLNAGMRLPYSVVDPVVSADLEYWASRFNRK